MKRFKFLLVLALSLLLVSSAAQAWDVYKQGVPDIDKPGVPPGPPNPADQTCWLAVAANLLGGGSWGNAQTIYNTLTNHFGTVTPGWQEVAMKWWLHNHGLNPASPFYNTTADYTNVHIHKYANNNATVADYDHLLDELDDCQYVAVDWQWVEDEQWKGHTMTLVGGNYWQGGTPQDKSVWHNSDADAWDGSQWVDDEVYLNSFPMGWWQTNWKTGAEAWRSVVLCPGLRKPEFAVENFDVAWYISDYDENGDPVPDFILTGEKAPPYPSGPPPDPDDYEIPRWEDDLTLYIDNEHILNYEKFIYVLIDYHDPMQVTPDIFVQDDVGQPHYPTKTEWSENFDQLLLTYHLDYQPNWEVIVFPDETYHDLDGNVFEVDVATVCVPEPFTFIR
jgi:hypothetical protein